MILVRVSGALIEKNGGVALGMSGSPIYIGDKLLGALSSTFAESDHTLAGITPIKDMMDGYDYLEKPGKVQIQPPISVDGVSYGMLDYTGTESGVSVLHPVTAVAPVAIRGISERTYEILKPYFKESGLDLLPFEGMAAGRATGRSSKGASVDIGKGKDVRAGDSIAVQLVRGDLDISAVGTVTAVDGNKVLAFGHPFFRKGHVNYLMADAPVLAIMNGSNLSFKITSTGTLRGSIRQDRGSAVIGYLDKYPLLVPMDVTVEDEDIGRKRDFHVKIVQDEDLLPNLIVAVLVNAVDNTIDRFGPGSATMDFTLKADGVDTTIERSNMFYSSYDVSAASLQELMMALTLLKENYLQESVVSGLKATIRLKSSHDTAAIVKTELFDPETGKILGKSEEDEKADGKDKTPEENGEEGNGDSEEGMDDDGGSDGQDLDDDDTAPDEEYDEDDNDGGDSDGDPEIEPEADPEEDTTEASQRNARNARLGRGARRNRQKITSVYPGQKLGLKVTIRPYKKDPVEQKIFIKVPKDIPRGTAVVRIFSGIKYMSPMFGMEGTFFDFMMEDLLTPEHGIREDRDGRKKETLDDIIKKFLERDRNNEIVATIASMSAAPPEKGEEFRDDYKGEGDAEEDDYLDEYDIESPPPDRAKKATDWVLFGGSTIRVRVTDSKNTSSLKDSGIEKSKIKALEQIDDGK